MSLRTIFKKFLKFPKSDRGDYKLDSYKKKSVYVHNMVYRMKWLQVLPRQASLRVNYQVALLVQLDLVQQWKKVFKLSIAVAYIMHAGEKLL